MLINRYLLLNRSLVLADFFPETYKLDVKSERETFFSHFQGAVKITYTLLELRGFLLEGSDVWICKPTGMNQVRRRGIIS